MRVAIASRWIDGFGGATLVILESARRFAEEGWDVHLFGERLDADRIACAGARAHRLAGWPWGSYLKRRLFDWRFGRLAKRERFDLVLGHGDILRQDLLFLHNCVHAAHEAVHGAPLPEGNGVGRLHRLILEGGGFRLLAANSEMMKREVIRRFRVPQERVRVVYPGHDPARFRVSDKEALGAQVRRRLGVGADEILVGLTTSGDFQKRGVDLFIAALAKLPPEQRARVHGLVAGKERGLERYRRLAGEAEGVRVHFLPAIPEVERYYHAMDVFLYPALYEEFGLSVLEALACGVPVLTSRRVGAAELLGGGAEGLLLDSPEPEGFAKCLAELIANPDLRKNWGEKGASAARGNTWDASFSKILGLCRELSHQAYELPAA